MKKILILNSILIALSCQSAFAIDIYKVPDDGMPTFQFNIYNEGETITDEDGTSETSLFTLSPNQRAALFDAAGNWKTIINYDPLYPPDPNKLPTFVVLTEERFNASAGSVYVDVGEDYLITEINAYINGKTPSNPSNAQGLITVGRGLIEDYPGWNHYTGSTVLYQADKPDLYSTMVHEIYHAMGLITNAQKHIKGDDTYYFSKDTESKIGIWDSGLRVYKGKMNTSFDPQKIDAADSGMSVKIEKTGTEDFDIVNYSPYFAGVNTLQVLTGSNSIDEEYLQKLIYENGGLKNYSEYYDEDDNPDWKGKVPLVLGLPVNVIEKEKPELSHIELRNSFMSHQMYQNWAILMEAELAVLKDIGYPNVELRDFFGKSYYLNNITDVFSTGYGAWNGTAYSGYSEVMNGIGLHIYGNNNFITQTSDTLSKGRYTIGTRIDGVENTYNLYGSTIELQGADSIGLAVTWGKDHNIFIEGDTTTDPPNIISSQVIASGENGIGVSFDFGKNVCGGMADDRGSYSSYSKEEKENVTPDIETQGALVNNFEVINSSITGKEAAIYISENAHVNKININNSTITGDIISKWNSIQSGANMYVQKYTDGKWNPVNKEKIEDIYFTELNFSGSTKVDGNIDGSNDILNTLVMSNADTGTLAFGGNNINVYSLSNDGTINFSKSSELIAQSGDITGEGELNFHDDVNLSGVRNIENVVNIDSGKSLFLSDGNSKTITINQLNANHAGLYMDLGDSFVLKSNSADPSVNTLDLKQVYVDSSRADSLDNLESIILFETAPEATETYNMNLGTSSANFFYKNNKYTFQQSTDKNSLTISKTSGEYGLSDAIESETTANYIVSVDEDMKKDLGTVQSEYFEISGDEIDLEGQYNGLVVDGSINQKTVLKTDIYGASDSNITLLNKANMIVETNDDIQIGKKGETALSINNSTFEADLEGHNMTFGGEIKGSGTNTQNLVIVSSKDINLDSVDNVALATKSDNTTLNNTMTNTIWQMEDKNINILNDSYLSSNGTNSIVYKDGLLNLANNKASNINLKSLTLNAEMETNLDLDLTTLQSDKFVFENPDDLILNNNSLIINNLNIINTTRALTGESYEIPFISSDYNNTNFLEHVTAYNVQNIMTPIFKYNLAYNGTDTQGDWMLTRGLSSDYKSYNPSVLAGPVAAQIGGYFTQLNSYDEAFYNMDMTMLMTREQRQAFKFKNKYAAADSGLLYDSTILRQERAEGWFRPYATFEKVGLKGGPTVENQAYGSYFGGESKLYELGHGWDGIWGIYIGYNGSHQNYNGVSVYQNGGTLGLNGTAYKGNFFTGLTVNSGASVGNAHTMYGTDDFTMLMAGVASKTGYNWELAKGKFIIQPSWLMSYSFVNTFDYTNAAGVRIKSDPLHAIQLQPELKFIGNLKNGWQPYASVAMVWNIMDNTRFKANDVSMPEMSVKPYVKYGVGIRKTWGERFTGFFQTYITNGGRNGVGLSAGFTWMLGKNENKK